MTVTPNRFVLLDLSSYFNNNGIAYEYRRTDGWFNIWGNTFPAEDLPPSLSIVKVAGVPFRFPSKEPGQQNNMSCCNQVWVIPPDKYDWIYMLAASERRSEDQVFLHYASGGVDSVWLRVSDFWTETPAHFGEVEAFRFTHMYYPRHTLSNMKPVIWRQRLPVMRQQEVLTHVSFPDNLAIHIFAATLTRGG